MKEKSRYIKSKANAKIRRLNHFLQLTMYAMAAIVLYDSFKHNTPLYYIGFYFAGLVVGRIYRYLVLVERIEDTDEFVLKSSKWDIALTSGLLVFRFVYGTAFLESFHVVWASDALYLFFIGIYRSKWKGMVKQIDEIVYRLASEGKK